MSLHDAAKHLAAHGRGEDKVLVHMTKDEVKSLNDLAMAHGGSLTINPQTGLPEAGFLSAILPMALGAGLMMVPGMQAYAAAGIVGALKTAQSGSLKEGLMAGLGAYGGASMAGSFGAAGSPALTTPTPTVTPAPTPISAGLSQVGAAPASIADAANSVTAVPGASPMLGAPTPAPVAPTAVGPNVPLGAPGATTAPGFSNLPSAAARGSAISSGASFGNAADWASQNKLAALGTAGSVASGMQPERPTPAAPDKDMGQRYVFSGNKTQPLPAPDVPSYEDMLTKQGNFGRQQNYFVNPTYTPISPEEAKGLYHFASGGPIENMSNNDAIGANTMYPMANMTTSSFATPYQTPQSTNMMSAMAPSGGGTVGMMSGEPNMQGTRLATGGISDAHYNLGGYSDGGRLLRGPGDGVSDSIPATIGHKQPARLADGEFVVPARIVSELGNGSTEAGARKLYAMMDRVQAARKKTVGKNKVAHNSRADKYLPA